MNTPTPPQNGIAATQHGQQMLNIIKQSVQREGVTDFEDYLKKLGVVMRDPKNKLVMFGNTVFFLKLKPPATVEMHTFSIDQPMQLVEAFKGVAKLLKNQGIKKALTYADSPAYVKLAKQTGLPVKIGQGAKVIKGVAKPVYTFEMDF